MSSGLRRGGVCTQRNFLLRATNTYFEGEIVGNAQAQRGHSKQERSAGHLFISVPAYEFVQIIRWHLREQGITDSWRSIRDTLTGQCRVTATFKRPDGRTLHVRKSTRAEPNQHALYDALGTEAALGDISKTIV